MTEAPSTPVDFDETEMNYELTQLEDHVKQLDRESLESIVMSLSRRLGIRFTESRRLASEVQAWRDTTNNQAEVIRELKKRSLATLQMRVHDWRKKAYPDTRGIELQALGVAEESGELCHAVLKYKQGIRGYDFAKTHDEVGDAIGDIIIYAMGVADMLDISVEEALYKTVDHVINRNITQGSDAGGGENGDKNVSPDDARYDYDGEVDGSLIVSPVSSWVNAGFEDRPDDAGCEAHGEVDGPCDVLVTHTNVESMTVVKYRKGDRVRVIAGEHFVGQLGTVHPAPGVDPYFSATELFVMIDGKDSPWWFPVEHLKHKDDHSDAPLAKDLDEWYNGPRHTDEPCHTQPKGVDYAGHVPATELHADGTECTGQCREVDSP